MTSQQIELIRANWTQIAPRAHEASVSFYENLFRRDPSVRLLFAQADMEDQGKALMQTLAIVVTSLDRLERIIPAVEALGRRHREFGVRDHHYRVVGAALMETLASTLGPAFTLAHRQAWVEAYATLAGAMKAAAKAA